MKKTVSMLSLAFCAAFCAQNAGATVFDDFRNKLQGEYMKPFARDIGGLMGQADFHSARPDGFPGVDVGMIVTGQGKPIDSDKVLKDSGVGAFALPVAQASIGLPANFGVSVRGFSALGATWIGGGVKYGILKHSVAKFLPDLTAMAYYDVLSHDYLKVKHFSMSLAASFDLPVVKPYLGVGFDNTKLETKVASVGGEVALPGDSVSVTEVRGTAGVSVTPFPFAYVFGGASLLHGALGFTGGLGVTF